MITREITTELKEAAIEYPVVTVFGPRQSGKTTLVKMTFPGMDYYSMENPDIRLAAQMDPRGFLGRLSKGGILDEIQKIPELLSYLQEVVDGADRSSLFVLTGSHQPELHQSVSQTLAGRTAVLTLLPFCLNELKNYRENWDPFDLIYFGCHPKLHQEKLKPERFFNGYLQTYLERDVRALVSIKNLKQFQQFLTLLAGRVGQIVNYSSLSNDVGVSSPTIKHWVEVLKASFVIFELPPFFENIRKRVVKSSKIYFTDTGLVSFLLGIESADQARRDPLRGSLYENLVISEFFKAMLNRGKRPQAFFFRDTQGNEIDLIIKSKRRLIPVEIKSAETFTHSFLKGFEKFRKLTADRCEPGYIFYNGSSSYTINGVDILNPFQEQSLLSGADL